MAIRQTGTTQTASQGSPVDEIHAKAEQGDAKAQYHLGLMSFGGHFVTQDLIEAYKWFSLAAEQSQKESIDRRKELAGLMTPEQIAEGKRRAAAFVAKKKTQ